MLPTFIQCLSKVIKLSWKNIKTTASYMPATDQTCTYLSHDKSVVRV